MVAMQLSPRVEGALNDPRIAEILDTIFDHEGGFVNDPDDPGGPTKHGLSLRYAKGLGVRMDLDQDGDVDIDDIRLVTPEIARGLYVEDFLVEPKIDTLPQELWAQLFDIAVNSGAAKAIQILQQVLNLFLQAKPDVGYEHIVEDGRMGPRTRAAAHLAQETFGPFLTNAIADQREAFMRSLARNNPDRFRKYVFARDGGPGGWIKRARSFKVRVG